MRVSAIVFTLAMAMCGLVIAANGDAPTTTNGDPLIPGWATGGGIIAALLGGPVFTVWFSWYMTTVRIPAIEKSHADQIEVREKRAADSQKQLIDNFRGDLVQMWAVAREDNTRLSNAIDRLSTMIESRLNKVH